MSTFLTEVRGFTPVIDALTNEIGLVGSGVYGTVWRYCNMSLQRGGEPICEKPTATIAGHLGVDRRTVIRHLQRLCALGYLQDLTPDRKNRPHIYLDTGKAQILGLVEARVNGVTESHSDLDPDAGVSESHSEGEAESHSEDPPSVTESDTIRGSLEESVDTDSLTGADAPGDEPPTPVPTSCIAWLERLTVQPNSTAVLMEAITTLFPGRTAPTFGRLGTCATRVGGPRPLMQYLWEFSTAYKQPEGPVCDFIEGVHKQRKDRQQKKPNRQRQRRSDGTTERAGRRPEEARDGIDQAQYDRIRAAAKSADTQ